MTLENEKRKLNEEIWKMKQIYDFQQFKSARYFGDNIYTGEINIDESNMDKSNLLENTVKFNNKCRPKNK